MELQSLPKTDLKVSPLCLGSMTFGAPVAETEAIQITHWALDHGINFIDTANMYEGYARRIGSAGGVAENILGKALQGRRDQVVLATKVGMKIGPNDDDEGLSRKHVFREAERSLGRLKMETIDLYYMHKPDPKTPLAESIQAFNDLIEAGKIRYWGISNFSAEQITTVLQTCDQNGWRRPIALQAAYSLLKRDIEAEILPLCAREQISVLPFQVLQGGLLTGKYQPGMQIPADWRAVEKPDPAWIMTPTDELFERLAALEQEASRKKRSLYQHALLALLAKPAVASLILGVKHQSQLEQALQAIAPPAL